MKKKLKIIFISVFSVLLLIFLIYLFIPLGDTIFSFSHELTKEKVDGEIFFDEKYYGYTEEGIISIPYFEELPKNITFKGKYDGIDFELLYDFPEDYLDYYEYEFLVSISDKAQLLFYDNKTNCKLNGDIYFGNNFVGTSKDGNFTLSKIDYDKFWNSEVTIQGLTDNCYGENENLPFFESWTISDLDYYFEVDEQIEFNTELNPRWPKYFEAMQGFVRPEETKEYLDKYLRFENDTQKDLDKISSYSIRYRYDSGLFNEAEYWQTPKEALKRGEGDCEDWAVATLSMMREYNNSLECYDALWETHLSVICFLKNSMIIYDQGDTKFWVTLNNPNLTELERKANIRNARNNYFENFGIESDERMLYGLFNERDLITFETEEDFVDWVVNR